MSLRRRALRWGLRSLVAAGLLIAVALAFVALALGTDWGKEQVRRAIVAGVGSAVSGTSLGAVEAVSLGGDIVVRDLVLGTDAIVVERAAIHCDLWPLLRSRLECDSVVVSNPRIKVDVQGDRVNLEDMVIAAGESGPAFAIELTGVRIEGGSTRVIVDADFDDVFKHGTVDASVHLADERTIDIAAAAATWPSFGLEATASDGRIELFRDDRGVVLSGDVVGAWRGLRAQLSGVRYQVNEVAVRADSVVNGPREALVALLRDYGEPELADELRTGGEFVGVIDKPGEGLPFGARGELALGSAATLGLSLESIDAPPLVFEGVAQLRDFNLAVLAMSAPDSALTGPVRFRVDLGERTNASAAFDVAGSLAGAAVDRLDGEVALAGDKVAADLRLATRTGQLAARAELDIADEVVIDQLTANGRGVRLDGLAGAAGGLADIDVRARGALDALTVNGRVQVARARWEDLRAGTLTATIAVASVDVFDPLAGLAGRIDADVRKFRGRGQTIDRARVNGRFADSGRRANVSVDLRGHEVIDRAVGTLRVERRAGSTDLTLTEARLRYGGLEWVGEGASTARVFDGGRVRVPRAAVRSKAGRLEANGELGGRADTGLRVVATAIDLGALGPLLESFGASTAELVGTLEADVKVEQRGGATGLAGNVEVNDLSVAADMPPLSGRFSFAAGLGRGALEGSFGIDRSGGAGTVSLESRTPNDVTDRAGWRRLTRADVSSATVEVVGVEVAAIDGYVGGALSRRLGAAQGKLDASLRFPSGPRRAADITADIAGVTVVVGDAVVEKLGALVRADWDVDALNGSVTLRRERRKAVTATVALDLGIDEWLRKAPGQILQSSVRAQADIIGLDLADLQELGALSVPVEGKLGARVVVSGQLAAPLLEVKEGEVAGFSVAGIRFSRLEFAGGWQPGVATAQVEAVQTAGGSLAVLVNYAPEAGEGSAEVRAVNFDLGVLRALSDAPTDTLARIRGMFNAERIALRYAGGRIDGAGGFTADGVRLLLGENAQELENLRLVGKLGNGRIDIEQLSATSGTGRIDASGALAFDGYVPSRLELSGEVAEFPYVQDNYVLSIDARLGLDVARATVESPDGGLRPWKGDLTIASGVVRMGDTGVELQPLGDLDDVVFVDRRAIEAAEGMTALPVVELRIATSGLRVEHPDASGTVKADLIARFVAARLASLEGRAEAVRGQAEIFDRTYRIVEAWADFTGPVEPAIHIVLQRAFPVTLVRVNVDGTISEPIIEPVAEGYTRAQALAIMLGQDPDDPALANVPAESQLGGAIASAVVGDLLGEVPRRLGIPIHVFRPQTDGFQLGWYLRPSVLVGYRARTGTVNERQNANEGTVEYRISRNWILEGRYGDAQVGALDLLFIMRF